MKNEAELIITSNTENIGLARISVATFASRLEFTLAEIEEIKVIVSEAVSNAIIHAYKNDSGKIKIKMESRGDQLSLIIKDQGVGIKDTKEIAKASYTTEDRMGLGLSFIKSFADKLSIKSKLGEGTELSIIKSPTENTATKN